MPEPARAPAGRRVVILQSNYLPWRGYFDLIHDADLFVFHDDLQYTKNDWRNRNKLKTPRGPEWLTVPVGTDEHRRIDEVALPADRAWAEKHWRLIREHYRTAPHFARYEPFFRDVYEDRTWTRLSELNQFLIVSIAREFLGLTTEFADSASFQLTSRKQERVLDLLRATHAGTYISGPAAQDYLDPENFRVAGIELIWKDYAGYPDYPQFHPPFAGAVSIIDLLFHTGPAAPDYIWGWRRTAAASP
jgi:hypothetical protein